MSQIVQSFIFHILILEFETKKKIFFVAPRAHHETKCGSSFVHFIVSMVLHSSNQEIIYPDCVVIQTVMK